MKLEPQKISSIKCVVSLRPRTTILYTISLGFMFHVARAPLDRKVPVTQTLSFCQMHFLSPLPVAFDRKLVSKDGECSGLFVGV